MHTLTYKDPVQAQGIVCVDYAMASGHEAREVEKCGDGSKLLHGHGLQVRVNLVDLGLYYVALSPPALANLAYGRVGFLACMGGCSGGEG